MLTASWPIAGRYASHWFDPVTYAFLAIAGGFVSILPFLDRERWRLITGPQLRSRLFWVGALGSGIPGILLLVAVNLTTPANAAIVCQVEVVYSAFLAAIFLGERIRGAQIAGTVLVLSGTGLVLGMDLGTQNWKGDLILLGTVWMFQVSHLVSKRLPKDVDYVTIAAARMFYGMLTQLPLFLGVLFLGHSRVAFTPASLTLLTYQAILLGSLNLYFWYLAIRNLELSKTTAVMLSYPALTLLYSWGLGLEVLEWNHLLGLVLAFTGALWITLQMKPGLPAGEVAPA